MCKSEHRHRRPAGLVRDPPRSRSATTRPISISARPEKCSWPPTPTTSSTRTRARLGRPIGSRAKDVLTLRRSAFGGPAAPRAGPSASLVRAGPAPLGRRLSRSSVSRLCGTGATGFMAIRTPPSGLAGMRWARVRAASGYRNNVMVAERHRRAGHSGGLRFLVAAASQIAAAVAPYRGTGLAVRPLSWPATRSAGLSAPSSSGSAMFKYRRSARSPAAAASRRADARSCGSPCSGWAAVVSVPACA